MYCSILFNNFWALLCTWTAGTGIATFGTNGTGVPIGVCNAPHNDIKVLISDLKSAKNLSPNITDSLAFLSPNNTLSDCIIVVGESRFILVTEFKLIVSDELNRIESVLELNNNLPEFNITCSSVNLSGEVGAWK